VGRLAGGKALFYWQSFDCRYSIFEMMKSDQLVWLQGVKSNLDFCGTKLVFN
jgi:hypothetical protein